MDLEEGVSTRLLIYAATLIAGGLRSNGRSVAMIEPLTDDADVRQGLLDLAMTIFG